MIQKGPRGRSAIKHGGGGRGLAAPLLATAFCLMVLKISARIFTIRRRASRLVKLVYVCKTLGRAHFGNVLQSAHQSGEPRDGDGDDEEESKEDEAVYRERMAELGVLKAVQTDKVGFIVGQHYMGTGPVILEFVDALKLELKRLSWDS